MADEQKESPVIEEPVEEPKSGLADEQVAALMMELEAAGVSKPEQLQSHFNNSREYGKVAQMLGDARMELREANSKLEALTKQQRSSTYDDDYNPTDAGAINIQDLVLNSVNKALDAREQRQRQIQENVLKTYAKINGDPEYSLVKDIWEERMKDPQFNMKINTGEVNPVDAFNDIKIGFYKGLVKKSAETIKSLQGKPTAAPHVEAGDRTPSLPPEPTSRDEKMQAYKDRVNKGGRLTEAEELDALMAVFSG